MIVVVSPSLSSLAVRGGLLGVTFFSFASFLRAVTSALAPVNAAVLGLFASLKKRKTEERRFVIVSRLLESVFGS